MNSMREVKIAAIQMSCSRDVKENIEKAAKLIRAAAEAGAQIILPSELFESCLLYTSPSPRDTR